MTIKYEPGPYQIYFSTLGWQQQALLPFMRERLGNLQTLAAVRYQLESDIRRAHPSLSGLSRESAEAILSQLEAWGVAAAVYHADAENKPQYDHNRFAVRLLDAGRHELKVARVLQEHFGIPERIARNMVQSTPKLLMENVSVDEAIEFSKRLHAAGAKTDIPQTRDSVWLETSAADVPRQPGEYTLVLQATGAVTSQLIRFVRELRPELAVEEVRQLVDEAPSILLRQVSLETAEIAGIRLGELGALFAVQSDAERERLGERIHPRNPQFGVGSHAVQLVSFDRLRRISLIKVMRELLPGIMLREAIDLLEQAPVVLVDGVNEASAAAIKRRLEEAGAEVALA